MLVAECNQMLKFIISFSIVTRNGRPIRTGRLLCRSMVEGIHQLRASLDGTNKRYRLNKFTTMSRPIKLITKRTK